MAKSVLFDSKVYAVLQKHHRHRLTVAGSASTMLILECQDCVETVIGVDKENTDDASQHIPPDSL